MNSVAKKKIYIQKMTISELFTNVCEYIHIDIVNHNRMIEQ